MNLSFTEMMYKAFQDSIKFQRFMHTNQRFPYPRKVSQKTLWKRRRRSALQNGKQK